MDNSKQPVKNIENCPHCGYALSSWDQVLLKVDRALVCKNCWYRITLPIEKPVPGKHKDGEKK